MGWLWTLFGGLPRDETEMERFAWLRYGIPALFAAVGLVVLAGSLLTTTRFPFWHPFMGGLLLLVGGAMALRNREVVKYARKQLVDVDDGQP